MGIHTPLKTLFTKSLFVISLILLISGCVRPATSTLPAASAAVSTSVLPGSTSVMTVLAPAATQTRPAASTLVVKTLAGTSIPPAILPQNTPTETATPEPTVQSEDFPPALIQIISPGSLSQLATPIRVIASLKPGDGNLVSLQLFGENERTIHDSVLKMKYTESGWVNLDQEIKFEINAAGEDAMLVLTTRDEFGRRIAQSAVPVLLIQLGKSDIEPNDFNQQPFVIESPRVNANVKGGVVTVSGFAHPFNTNPLIVELLTESGGVMDNAQTVRLPRNKDNQTYLPFTVDIPYDVDIETPVRLSIRQRSTQLPNIDIALSSQLITLLP